MKYFCVLQTIREYDKWYTSIADEPPTTQCYNYKDENNKNISIQLILQGYIIAYWSHVILILIIIPSNATADQTVIVDTVEFDELRDVSSQVPQFICFLSQRLVNNTQELWLLKHRAEVLMHVEALYICGKHSTTCQLDDCLSHHYF